MERKDTTINGRNYSILVPSVRKSMPLCSRVAVLIGPAIAVLGDNAKNGEGLAKFSAALQGIDPIKLDVLLMDAVQACGLVDGNNQSISDPTSFERYFGQHREDVFAVCAWCVWETVKDFFPQLATLGPAAASALSRAQSA